MSVDVINGIFNRCRVICSLKGVLKDCRGIPMMLAVLMTLPVVFVARGSFFSLMNYLAKEWQKGNT